MSDASFAATASKLPDVTVIELHGDLDGGAREALAAAYDDSGTTAALRLDFGRITYIDSTGIALIVELLARARTDGRPVTASGLSEHYREIFQITRLTDFITILAPEQPPGPAERQDQR